MILGKKGQKAMSGWTIALIVFAVMYFGGFGPFKTQSTQGTSGGTAQQDNTINLRVEGNCVEDTTVTFNHVNKYAEGTVVSQGARILLFDGDVNVQVANGGTRTYSPTDIYRVLLGNLTTTLTAGTDYYPQYVEGVLPCEKGTVTLQGKLAQTTTAANLVFTAWNSNDQVASGATNPQTLGANDDKTMKIRFTAPDNGCFGNPYAAEKGGKNVMCFNYNSTVYSSVSLVGAQPASKPKAITSVGGKDTACYQWDVICDNAEFNGKVNIKTSSTQPIVDNGAVGINGHNISITVSDVTFDFDTDNMALVTGVEDEPKTRNDIGVADFNAAQTSDAGFLYGLVVT